MLSKAVRGEGIHTDRVGIVNPTCVFQNKEGKLIMTINISATDNIAYYELKNHKPWFDKRSQNY
jgi:hypothetical protein